MLNNKYFQSLMNFFAISSSPKPGQPDHMFDLYMSCRASAAKQGSEKVYSETLFSPLDNMDRKLLTEVTEKGYFPQKIGFLLEASEAELLRFQEENPTFFTTEICKITDTLPNSDQAKVVLFLTSTLKMQMQNPDFTKELESWSLNFWNSLVSNKFQRTFNGAWNHAITNGKLDHTLRVTQDVHTEILLNKGLLGLGKSNDLDYLKDHQIDLIRKEIHNLLDRKLAAMTNFGNNANLAEFRQKYDWEIVDKNILLAELYESIITGLNAISNLEKKKYLRHDLGYDLDVYLRELYRINSIINNYKKLSQDHGDTETLASLEHIGWINEHIIVPSSLNKPINPIIPYFKFGPLFKIHWQGSSNF